MTRTISIGAPEGSGVTFYNQVKPPGQTDQVPGLVIKKRGRVPAHVRVIWGQAAVASWSLVTNDFSLLGCR